VESNAVVRGLRASVDDRVWGGGVLPLFRWACLALLLVAELLAMGLCFDTVPLAHQPQWWARTVDSSPAAPAILMISFTATILISGSTRLRSVVAEVSGLAAERGRFWPCYFLGHLSMLAAFTALTWFVLGENMRVSTCPGLWFAGWVASGVWTLAFWGAAVVPPSVWPLFLRLTHRQLMLGTAIGLVALKCGSLTAGYWRPLSSWTFESVRWLIALVVPECFCEPAEFVVGTPSFSVCIDRACSGYQGIGLICVFFAFYLWFDRKNLRFPHAMLLIPLGVAAVWLANVVRIAALILVGTWFSPDVALGGFHSQAGWIAFNAVALGLAAIAGRWQFLSAAAASKPKDVNPVAPYLAPFLAGLAAAMLASAFSSGFDWLYPLRVLAIFVALWCFRTAYARFSWQWSWAAVGLGALTSLVWIALAPMPLATDAGKMSPVALAGAPFVLAAIWWLFRTVGYVIAAPLAEELAFRGYLTRRLISAEFQSLQLGQFSWLSFLVSSVLFGVFHGQFWLAGCVAGMLFALALYHRGRMSDAVLAHATANGLLAIYAVTTGNWFLWS
jgi:exosortase E/protease (VPEID-CTERM system)